MKSLAEAWNWYEYTKRNLERMRRLGTKYWADLPWDSAALGRDDEFRTLEGSAIETETAASLLPIDDLAVIVLFSVFEAIVRSHLVALVQPEAARLTVPILQHAANDAIRGVQEGSFFNRVLEPLKEQGQVPADLVTQVNQVRDYRNWVAHGRRDQPKNKVNPQEAFRRLQEFLQALGIDLGAPPPT